MANYNELRSGFETAYIEGSAVSSQKYRPQFVSNNYKKGKKVLASIEEELAECDQFQISVAFITEGGIVPLLQTLRTLEKNNIPGKILTTNYLNFTEPKALERLKEFHNITIKMFDVETANEGFHTKGYIFKKEEIYHIILGSSNMTKYALSTNYEWNTKIVSTEQGEVAKEILEEFESLWDSKYSLDYDDFIDKYKEKYIIVKRQREIAERDEITSLEKYKLQPNSMQVGFIANLKKIIDSGEKRALLISATGTGKTYASAFAIRELGFKRVLFIVHRSVLAWNAKKSYEKIFPNDVSMGRLGGGYYEYDKNFVFATVETLCKENHLKHYHEDDFDCIVLDEAHHSPADSYKTVMDYFKPKLFLGMTATPDKRDDYIVDRNVYERFNHQIAYEIRLQQAMEDDLLCPFHYFGISDISLLSDTQVKAKKISVKDFNTLTSDARVKHVIEQALFYGYSGDRVKGLVFCSRIEETEELSRKFNQIINPETGRYYRTVALSGSTKDSERERAFERLAMSEKDAKDDMTPLDYIFSVDILNEGVDIVEINQVIMLRPTESPIVFIQQLGRGLRKAKGKEFVVILDFIGNYKNNFMIPVALSGDRTYNPDTIRKYVISGNNVIPGSSTIHFDEISRDKIFASINKIPKMKDIIKESYVSLKNRLGRVPYLLDFYENGEVDPMVIVREYKTYSAFLEEVEAELYAGKISAIEYNTLEYLSKTILSGARPHELEIMRRILKRGYIEFDQFKKEFSETYGYEIRKDSFDNAVEVLQGKFVKDSNELKQYSNIDIISCDSSRKINRLVNFENRIRHYEFYKQLDDIVEVGLRKYHEKREAGADESSPFVLYEKYSRRDVCLLMNCGKDLSSTMFGMKRIGDDAFVFVTYNKKEVADKDKDKKQYVDGKPDYADQFVDNLTFNWETKIGCGINSSYFNDVMTAKRRHLLVQKDEEEKSLYYMGQFDVHDYDPAKKLDNNNKEKDIVKIQMKMQTPAREDLLRYFESDIKKGKKEKKVV